MVIYRQYAVERAGRSRGHGETGLPVGGSGKKRAETVHSIADFPSLGALQICIFSMKSMCADF
jgi:hypothetical protein